MMPELFQYIPVLLIFIPIFTALMVYVIDKEKISFIVFVGQAILTILFVLYVLFLAEFPTLNKVIFGGWDYKIAISLLNDKTSLAFVGLSIFMWWIVLLYTFNTNRKETKFLFFLMFLQGIFLGLLQTNDLFNLFVFLELTTVLVAILIAYKKTGPSFRAAIYYLLLNTVGAMVFLIGVILLYYVVGTINIELIKESIGDYANHTTIRLAFVMMLAGISVKAALFPVFTWLPKAHGVAQSTISALLSGLVVKGALYLFIRIHNEMFALANYQTHELFFWIGVVTAIVGVAYALSQKDMKQILAYHTVSQVGIMMMGLSSLSPEVQFAGFLHIFNHAFFKSLLFLGAGMIIKTYQTKKVSEVRGVLKTMPIVGIVMIVAMLSISGSPMFNGFVSKSIVKYGLKDEMLKTVLFWIINLGTTTSFIKFAQVLFGPKQNRVYARNIKQHASLIILAIVCLGIGILYIPIANWFAGLDISKVRWLSANSFMDYGIFIAAGLAFYQWIIVKDYWPTRKLREMKITFENANYLFVLYLAVLALVVIIPNL